MGVIEASGFARKGVPMTGKQSTAEWLRGIVDGAHRNETYPTCAGIVRTFFGLECPDVRSCGSCILAMLTAIAGRIDAERALPEGVEWPRFEGGELVKVGDMVGSDELFTAKEIAFESERWLIKASARSVCGCFHGAFGEPVKRPTLKVLDADGVPIEVGDTVYGDDETSPLTVVRLFKDATGATLVDCVGSACSIGTYYTVAPSRLTHERPDSWERIEEDAKLAPRAYLEARGMNPEKTERVASMMADLVRRAKALAKAGEQG